MASSRVQEGQEGQAGQAAPAPRPPRSSRLLVTLQVLPDLVVLAAASTVLCVGVLVAAGRLTTAVALAGGGLLAVTAALGLRRLAPAPDRADALGSVLVLLGAAAWFAVNLPLVSEHVFVDRDPSVLTLSATWLVDHPSPLISTGDGSWEGPGFEAGDDGLVRTQNSHAVPGVAAVVGRLAGPSAVLWANLLVGSVVLVACYALARRWVAPGWALLVPVWYGLGLPFLVVARGLYTEPTVTLFVLAALTVHSAAARHPGLRSSAAVGALVGGAVMVRIDGLLVATALVPCLALVLARRPDLQRWSPGRRGGWVLGRLTAFVVAVAAVAAVGAVDLLRSTTPVYLQAYGPALTAGTALFATSSLVCAAGVALWARSDGSRAGRAAGRASRASGGWSVVVAVVCASVVLAAVTAPLWLVGHQFGQDGDEAYASVIARSQERLGLPVDGSRSYNEYALTSLSWYHGWVTVALGGAGLVAAAVVGLRARTELLVLPVVVLPLLALYTYDLNITPDQVWATRRLVVVVLPLLLLAAGWAAGQLWRGPWAARWLALAAAVTMVVAPANTLPGVAGQAQDEGAYARAQELCELVGDRPVVVAGAEQTLAPTLAVLCGSEVVTSDRVSAVGTARLELELGSDVVVVTSDLAAVQWTDLPLRPTVEVELQQWSRELLHEPRDVTSRVLPVFLGETRGGQPVRPRP